MLTYRPEVVDREGAGALVLSAALPGRLERYSPSQAAPFLDGLLPDGWARAGLERRFDVHRVDSFSLLAAVGRECAGAVTFVPAGDPRVADRAANDSDGMPGGMDELDDRAITDRLAALRDDPFGVDDRTRLTLAGSPWKLPLHRRGDGTWLAPAAGVWSTHLLRPEPPDRKGLVATEAYALAVLRQAGARVVDADAVLIGQRPVLVVGRYDRAVDPQGVVTRIHQEDCGQALGADGTERAQRDGGPSLVEMAELIRDLTTDPEAELVHLLGWLVASAVFGAVDGTARDLALVYPRDAAGATGCQLAPIASMAGTADYADRPRALGLSVDGVDDLDAVGAGQILGEAARWGLPAEVAATLVTDRLAAVEVALDDARGTSDPGDDVVVACRERIARLRPG